MTVSLKHVSAVIAALVIAIALVPLFITEEAHAAEYSIDISDVLHGGSPDPTDMEIYEKNEVWFSADDIYACNDDLMMAYLGGDEIGRAEVLDPLGTEYIEIKKGADGIYRYTPPEIDWVKKTRFRFVLKGGDIYVTDEYDVSYDYGVDAGVFDLRNGEIVPQGELKVGAMGTPVPEGIINTLDVAAVIDYRFNVITWKYIGEDIMDGLYTDIDLDRNGSYDLHIVAPAGEFDSIRMSVLPTSSIRGVYVLQLSDKARLYENRYSNAHYKKLTLKMTWLENTLSAKGKTAKVKYSKLKKKNQTLAVSKVLSFKDKGQGKLTYKKESGSKKISINKTNGKVTVKKGLKKKTYKVTVSVKAAGNGDYRPATKKVSFKVKVC